MDRALWCIGHLGRDLLLVDRAPVGAAVVEQEQKTCWGTRHQLHGCEHDHHFTAYLVYTYTIVHHGVASVGSIAINPIHDALGCWPRGSTTWPIPWSTPLYNNHCIVIAHVPKTYWNILKRTYCDGYLYRRTAGWRAAWI